MFEDIELANGSINLIVDEEYAQSGNVSRSEFENCIVDVFNQLPLSIDNAIKKRVSDGQRKIQEELNRKSLNG